MALVLTIPDMVESMHASASGQHLPLVVLTTDAQILALDSVFVSEASIGSDSSVAHVTFVAQAVRIV